MPDGDGNMKVCPPVAHVAPLQARRAPAATWQVYTHDNKVVTVNLTQLSYRVSPSQQCICTYTDANQACRCGAKFSIIDEDRQRAEEVLKMRRAQLAHRSSSLAEEDAEGWVDPPNPDPNPNP